MLGLAPVYLLYYGALGILIPYWVPYLNTLGLDPVDIGAIMAVFTGWRLVAPTAWGWLADHSGRRMGLVRVAAVLALACFAAVAAQTSVAGLMLAMSAFGIFWTAMMPQMEANTLAVLGNRVGSYGRIRLWGSVGFIVAVVAGGWWFDRHGLAGVPWISLGLIGLMAAACFTAPTGPAHGPEVDSPGFWRVLRQPRVIALLVTAFLVQAAFGPYYTFFSLYLEQLGYARSTIGLLWALGAAAEILVFIYSRILFQRFGRRSLLLAALAFSILRWAMTASLADDLVLLVLAQVLHMASFGLFHAVAVVCIHEFFPGRTHGRGQALYSSAGFGAGGALGSLVSGYAWSLYGPASMFWIAAVLVGLAFLISLVWIRPDEHERPDGV